MKRWNGTTRPSTYIFSAVCYFIGMAFLWTVTLGQLQFDDRDGPGVNPITRMPDGRVGISEFATMVVGFCLMIGIFWLIRAASL